MREVGGSFAERVEQFESRFGAVDGDLLGVLAQAAFLCWHNVEIRNNLFALCEAIRTGRPTVHHYHCQITAHRWNEVHTYLAGIQRWLGIKRPLPPQVDSRKVEEIGRWLGDRTPAKEALAELLLIRLVDDLLNYASLTQFERSRLIEHEVYSDFSAWYLAEDGTPCAVARVDDSSRQPFADPRLKDHVDRLVNVVRAGMSSCPEDAEKLISSIKRQTQPPCMHRFSRYLDVQITSIGAYKWRGSLPPETVPKAEWHAFTKQAQAALNAWVNDAPASSEIGQRIYAALGEPAEPKQAIVRDFGLFGFWGVGDGPGWDWLVRGAQTEGTNAYAAFHLERVFGPASAPHHT
jgi:hypothetical protein